MTRPGTHNYAFDDRLEPEQRLLIAVFYQAKVDLLSKTKRNRLGAELFLQAHGIEPDKVREAHKDD